MPMEVMGLMLGTFVDDYTVRVIDVFAMPQCGTGVSIEAVDPVFQMNMLDMLKQTGRYVFGSGAPALFHPVCFRCDSLLLYSCDASYPSGSSLCPPYPMRRACFALVMLALPCPWFLL